MKKIQYNGISKLLSGIVSKINNLIDIVEMKADWEQTDPTAFDYIKNKPDSLDEKVKQENTTSDEDYRVLLSKSANDITEIDKTWKNSDLKYNPFTGNLTAVRLNGNEIGNDPQFTDTTYENKAAVQGGSAESLVTTGEKYTWNNKVDIEDMTDYAKFEDLATVATSGSYNDLIDKPTIPAGQVQSDWEQDDDTEVDYIKNKPILADVATSGSYNDLTDTPTIPTVNNATLTIQKNGTNIQTFTANASSNKTANITVPVTQSDLTEVKLTNEDLDDVTYPGFYYAAGGNTVTNKPTGYNNFGLVVIHNASGSQYVQIISNENGSYRRIKKADGTWTSWAEDKFTDTTYTASGVVSIDANNNITSTAEVNQNTFAKVKVGSTTITADAKQDTLELVQGDNITLTPDTTNDKVTITATDTTYTAGTRIAISSSNVISTTAEINQNAFSNVKVGDVTIEADSKTDILELIQGSNVTLTPNATNDSITIAATDTNTHRPIQLNGTQILGNNTTALNLKNGNNISMTNSSGTVTINATGIPTALSDLSTDTTHRVVTDTQISSWDAKAGSDTKVTQTNNTANTYLPILLANSTTSPETTTVKKNTNLTANPSNGYMDVNSLRIHSNVADHDSNFARLYCANTGDRRYKLPVDKANDSELAVVADIPTQASDIGALPSTTKYAGSSTVGGVATSAAKLSNTSKVGDTNRPVYFTANGVPAQIAYTIDKSVPSTAVFTDTTYTFAGGTDKFTVTPSGGSAQTVNIANGGVRNVETGTAFGSLSVNTGGTSADKVINMNAPQQALGGLDLNNYTESGIYYFKSTTTPPYTNMPNSTNGILIVIRADWDTRPYVKQIWLRHGTNNTNDHNTYIRSCSNISGGAWSNWHRLSTTGSFYGTCSTAAAEQNKIATINGNLGFVLEIGTVVGIKFTNTNTYSATTDAPVTLNVNDTGAKNIYYNNSATPTGTNTKAFGYANRINYYMYDGTYWVFLSASVDDNTTYSTMAANEVYTGTVTTAKIATAARLNTDIKKLIADALEWKEGSSLYQGSTGTVLCNKCLEINIEFKVGGYRYTFFSPVSTLYASDSSNGEYIISRQGASNSKTYITFRLWMNDNKVKGRVVDYLVNDVIEPFPGAEVYYR